ncbi:MAG: peptidylprolyl isomerase [Bacteroidia bacterium]|nr:peptidylprolyl isomerase [Bacteroidia bacterium]
MNRKLIILLVALFIAIVSCKNEQVDQTNKLQIKPKKQFIKKVKKNSKTIVKSPDSINHKNAIDFLIAYGDINKANKVLLKTRLGNITVQLYEDTPLHRANFIFLSEVGYFNTTCFHRVVPDFIVQGGNAENSNTLRIRNKYENYSIPQEFRDHRKHKYGALAAARDWEDNPSKKSNPFEFYIIQGRQGAYHLDGEHTVFGEVISGFKVLDKIANLKAGRDQWPLNDVFITATVID